MLGVSFDQMPGRMGKILTEMSRKEIQDKVNKMRAHSSLV